MQSLEKVPRLLKEVERAPGSVQVGSAGSEESFRDGSFGERSVPGTDLGTTLAVKWGNAEQTMV